MHLFNYKVKYESNTKRSVILYTATPRTLSHGRGDEVLLRAALAAEHLFPSEYRRKHLR